jgi:cytoskeletal protein CcmA (bactofilin family)
MFTKSTKNAIETAEINNSHNILGNGTTVEGSIATAGNLRIDGKIIGAITSKAKLILGPNAWVKGNIIAQNADVEGAVEGTIDVSGLLTLKRTAVIKGDISTGKLVFEEGAKFNGKCKMEAASPLSKHTPETPESSTRSTSSTPGKAVDSKPTTSQDEKGK